jgi:hypothetical protein
MPPADAPTIVNQLSIVRAERNGDQVRPISDALQRQFPELKLEEIFVDGGAGALPTGTAVLLVFDKETESNAAATAWLENWKQRRGSTPLIPVTLDPNAAIPPKPFAGLKARIWPQDEDELLTTIGAYLGLALRPGRNKLFISYRQSDSSVAARQLHDHLAGAGFDVFLDEADDRFDNPRLEAGDDVQVKITERLDDEDAAAVIVLDSPHAPQSKWVRIEIDEALGRRLSILPVVLHTTDAAPSSRFRSLAALHRRICVRTADVGGKLQFSDSQLAEIGGGVERHLMHVYMCRSVQPRRLERVFAANQWTFGRHRRKADLYDAQTGKPPQSVVRMLACFSCDDPIFPPSVRAFLKDIGDLAAAHESFLQHLYLYPGNILYDADFTDLLTEIPELTKANTRLIQYDEAAALVNRIAGGLSVLFN